MYTDIENSVKTIAKGSIIYIVGLFCAYFASYVYRIILATWLGPESYGFLSVGFALVGLVGGIVGLGLSEGVYRYVSYYNTLKNPEKVRGTFLSALKLTIPFSILSAATVFVFARTIANYFFHSPNLVPILRLFSIVIPLTLIMSSYLQVARAHKKLQYEVISQSLVENVVKIICTLFLLIGGYGLIGAAFSYVISVLVATIFAAYFVEKKVCRLLFGKVKAIYNLRELATYSAPLFLVNLIAPITTTIDSLFIGYFMGGYAVGIYNIALPTAQLTKIAFPALTVLTLPIFTELLANKKILDIEGVYKVITRWIFIITLPLTLGVIVFSKQIVNLLFGNAYSYATVSLIILATGYFVYSITGPARNLLNALGRTEYALINCMITVAISVTGCFFLIPKIGIAGAAIYTAASFATTNVLALIELNKFMRVWPFTRKWIRPAFCGIIAIMVLYFLTKSFNLSSVFLLLLVGLCFFVLYVELLLVFRVLESEDLLILNIVFARIGLKSAFLEKILRKFIR